MKHIEECLHSVHVCPNHFVVGMCMHVVVANALIASKAVPKTGPLGFQSRARTLPSSLSRRFRIWHRQHLRSVKVEKCWKHVRIIMDHYTSQFFIFILLPRSNTLCNKIAAKGMRKITKVRLCWRSWWHRSTPAPCHIFPHLPSTFINSIRVSRSWQDRFPFGSWVGSRDNQMSTNRYWQIVTDTNR